MCVIFSGITQGVLSKLHILQSSGSFCLQLSAAPLFIHTALALFCQLLQHIKSVPG